MAYAAEVAPMGRTTLGAAVLAIGLTLTSSTGPPPKSKLLWNSTLISDATGLLSFFVSSAMWFAGFGPLLGGAVSSAAAIPEDARRHTKTKRRGLTRAPPRNGILINPDSLHPW